MRKKIVIEEKLTSEIIGAAIEVHRIWGPGLYEEIYDKSLCRELKLKNISFENQLKIPLIYKGEQIGDDLRLDLLVGKKVVVELKAVKEITGVHEAQLLTYMKLTSCRVGLIINFNVAILRKGIRRMVL